MTRFHVAPLPNTATKPGAKRKRPLTVLTHSSSPTLTMFARLSVLAGLFVAAVTASNVVELNPDNFDRVVGQGKPALVEL